MIIKKIGYCKLQKLSKNQAALCNIKSHPALTAHSSQDRVNNQQMTK